MRLTEENRRYMKRCMGRLSAVPTDIQRSALSSDIAEEALLAAFPQGLQGAVKYLRDANLSADTRRLVAWQDDPLWVWIPVREAFVDRVRLIGDPDFLLKRPQKNFVPKGSEGNAGPWCEEDSPMFGHVLKISVNIAEDAMIPKIARVFGYSLTSGATNLVVPEGSSAHARILPWARELIIKTLAEQSADSVMNILFNRIRTVGHLKLLCPQIVDILPSLMQKSLREMTRSSPMPRPLLEYFAGPDEALASVKLARFREALEETLQELSVASMLLNSMADAEPEERPFRVERSDIYAVDFKAAKVLGLL